MEIKVGEAFSENRKRFIRNTFECLRTHARSHVIRVIYLGNKNLITKNEKSNYEVKSNNQKRECLGNLQQQELN